VKFLILFFGLITCSQPRELVPDPCAADSRTYKVTGTTTWNVTKNEAFWVSGKHQVFGELSAPLVAAIDNDNFKFDIRVSNRPDSGSVLRDDRISDYVFGSPLSELLTLKLSSIKEVIGSPDPTMPKAGETTRLVLDVSFAIAGAVVQKQVAARISSHTGHLTVTTEESVAFDMRKDLLLSARLDEMMSLVEATLGDAVTIDSNLILVEKGCE